MMVLVEPHSEARDVIVLSSLLTGDTQGRTRLKSNTDNSTFALRANISMAVFMIVAR